MVQNMYSKTVKGIVTAGAFALGVLYGGNLAEAREVYLKASSEVDKSSLEYVVKANKGKTIVGALNTPLPEGSLEKGLVIVKAKPGEVESFSKKLEGLLGKSEAIGVHTDMMNAYSGGNPDEVIYVLGGKSNADEKPTTKLYVTFEEEKTTLKEKGGGEGGSGGSGGSGGGDGGHL